jgi:hypothetical protein
VRCGHDLDAEDQRLTIYTVEPDSPTARVLPILSSWSADAEPVGSDRHG